MTPHEKMKFIENYEKDYEKIRVSFVEAVNKAGGNGFALWNELKDTSAEELIILLCSNNIYFTHCPTTPKDPP